ncbi:hypothetical protein O0L34_g2639 [Tuta absoluta]|nr:hypothetical protein O0L34_g2639 [Tuta absoluta]
MESFKTYAATCEAADNAAAGTFPSPEVAAIVLGECDAADSAAAGTFPSPEVTASILGECDAADSAAAGTFPSPEVTYLRSPRGEYAPIQIRTDQESSTVDHLASHLVTRLDAYNKFVAKSRQLYRNGRPKDLSTSERTDVVFALFGNTLKPCDSIATEEKKRLNSALARFIERSE